MLTVGSTARVTVDRIVHGGDGMARLDGQAVFIPGAAPGDELDIRVTEAKNGFVRAECAGVVQPGPGRTQPACPHYGECGGCNLMHLSYSAQLEAKRGIVVDAWRRIGGIIDDEGQPVFGTAGLGITAVHPLGYRNRAQFHFDDMHRVGYSRRLSNTILPVTTCPILAPALQAWLEAHARRGAWDKLQNHMHDRNRFVAFGWRDSVWLDGPDGDLGVEVGGHRFRFHIRGFFQSNLDVLEYLVPAVMEDAGGAGAADLYCGVGLFGSFLVERFGKVTCVEQDQRSIAYAQANVGSKARFQAASMEDWTRSPQAREPYDYVVLDPPRSGLAAPVRDWLVNSKVPVVGYVSCDPVTLARDAGHLVRAGYEIESARMFDFYPQTSHIEMYVRFRRV